MPHSPRWYRDKLSLLDAGTGYFRILGTLPAAAFQRHFLSKVCQSGRRLLATVIVEFGFRTTPRLWICRCRRIWKRREEFRPLWTADH